MSKSARLRAEDLRGLFRLTGECRDLGDDHDAWHRHWYASLARMVGAELAMGGEAAWVGGRLVIVAPFDWGWENGLDRGSYLEMMATMARATDDISRSDYNQAYFAHPARQAGASCLSRTDLLADGDWYRSWAYPFYRAIGIDHTLMCYQPVPGVPGAVNALYLSRPLGVRRDFTRRHRRLVEESYAQLAPLLGGALARHTSPSPADLPPRVREVLACLLEGDGDKQVARRLGISPYTVNQYTKQIYRHFRVAGRTELLALWLRRAYPAGFPWANG
jgi:DNA-binding CsgD family transcriptional regulator